MTLYETLELFKTESIDAFYIYDKSGIKEVNLFGGKIDFYRIKQAVEYYEDEEDIYIASFADKTVVNIDLRNDIITIEE